jgi:hypothetical protein
VDPWWQIASIGIKCRDHVAIRIPPAAQCVNKLLSLSIVSQAERQRDRIAVQRGAHIGDARTDLARDEFGPG